MSYLNDVVRKTAGGPSTAEQLAAAEKRGRGNTSFAQFLRDERAAELAGEQAIAARVAELTKINCEDALAMEKLRIEGILTLPETDANATRLNNYAPKVHEVVDVTKPHSRAEWEAWSTPAIQMAQDFIKVTKKQEPMTQPEINQVLRYLITNQLFIGDHQSWISGFSNLCNHGVIRVPVPVAEVTPEPIPAGRFDSVKAELESLRAEALTHKYGSRDRENLERRAYEMELKLETLGNSRHSDVLQELTEAANLVLTSDNQLRFFIWLDSPKQVRRYDASRTSVRLAFCEFFGCPQLLTDEEKLLVSNYRNIESMTSTDIKNQVGSRNTYDPNNEAYNARRS